MTRLSAVWSDIAPWVVGVLVALTANMAADGIKGSFESWMEGESVETWMAVSRGVYIVLFVGGAAWLYGMRKRIFQPPTRFLRNESPEKREHLVLFLSNLDTNRLALSDRVPRDISLTGDLEEDLAALMSWKQQVRQYWPWEMPLRSIKHHLGRLKTITIICSPESIRQVHWFAQVLAYYDVLKDVAIRVFIQDGNRPALIICPTTLLSQGGWEFEQFDQLSRAVWHLLREFKRQRVADNQIMIDFTGGQKVTSVVAASVTFNRTIKAQYVQTNWPHDVISYDIQLGSSETGGLGL